MRYGRGCESVQLAAARGSETGKAETQERQGGGFGDGAERYRHPLVVWQEVIVTSDLLT